MLQHGLSPGKGNTASGLYVKSDIFFDLPQKFFDSISSTVDGQCLPGTCLHAFLAALAEIAIENVFTEIGNAVDFLRTEGNTFSTAGALFRKELKSCSGRNTFRIMTPGTFQITAFQENSRSCAGTIIQRKALDIAYKRMFHTRSPPF